MKRCESCGRVAFEVCPDCAELYPRLGFVLKRVGLNKVVLYVPEGYSVSVRDKKHGAELMAYTAPVKRHFGKLRQGVANGLRGVAELMAKK